MDVFKLAFETIVVGLLTLVCLGVAAYLLFPNLQVSEVKETISGFVEKNSTPTGVGVLLLAYCLGSAVLPIAEQLVNDEHWPLNESAIRCEVFNKQQQLLSLIGYTALPKIEPRGYCSHWTPVFFPNDEDAKRPRLHRLRERLFPWPLKKNSDGDEFADKVLTHFQQQKSTVLQAPQNTEGLRQLHERIVVLRGMVFSLFVLFLILLCSYFAKVNGGASHWVRQAFGIFLAVGLAAFALLNGWDDLYHRDIRDIPVLETLLVVINIFGFVVVRNGVKLPHFQARRCVLVTVFFLGLAYGGWMWSEIIYDQQITSWFAVLEHNPAVPKENESQAQ